ncbi:MAG: adenine phosphoribosyltransferase, partial [Opitutaceae bacterium]
MNAAELSALLKSKIRTVRGWPLAGVNFRDISTLFQDPAAFRVVIDAFVANGAQLGADLVAAVDARGFIIGGALAYQMGKPIVLVRKKGKLPYKTVSEAYAL